jgi:transposase
MEPASQGTENSTWAGHEGGLTSKIHAVVDANGLPVQLGLTPGETHDNRLCPELLTGLQPQSMLLADRGYDADWIRALVNQQGAYRVRNLVERSFNKIKQCRRIATRYDKLAANYLAFIKLAAIRIWLRSYESAPWLGFPSRHTQQEKRRFLEVLP